MTGRERHILTDADGRPRRLLAVQSIRRRLRRWRLCRPPPVMAADKTQAHSPRRHAKRFEVLPRRLGVEVGPCSDR
jgi:hypothetical protein